MTDSTERTSGAGWLPFILLLPALLYVGFWYDRLPAVVPVHFNIQGTADGYGSKQVLLLLPLLGLVFASAGLWFLKTSRREGGAGALGNVST